MTERRDPRYVAGLALAAALILVLGTWLKPSQQRAESTVSTGPPVSSQTDRARLDRLAQKGELERTSTYFSQIAFSVASQLVRLEFGASGVFWDDSGLIVTAGLSRRFPETVLADAGGPRASLLTALSAPPALPAAILRVPAGQSLRPVQPIDDPSTQTGAWAVAVWRTPDRRYAFAPGLNVGVTPSNCRGYRFDELLLSVPLTETMAGGGVFDLDGGLLAVILRCGDRLVAMTPRSVTATIAECESLEGRVLTRYGVGVSVLHQAEDEYFQVESGVLVREVWKEYPGDDAGVAPGDVITHVDGVEVQSIDDLLPLVVAEAPTFGLAVIRANRTVTMTLPGPLLRPSESDPIIAAGAGPDDQPSAAGFRIEWIPPGSRAEAAGIRAGDLLLEVDRVPPRDAAAVRQSLAGEVDRSSFLILQRGPRVWGALIEVARVTSRP